MPHLAAWGKTQIDNALAAAGTNAAAVGLDKLGQSGVLYHGLEVLGGGAILGGLVLGAITVCIIDRALVKAAAFAAVGALLTFFGFMHGERIGIGQGIEVAASYLGFAIVLLACARFAHIAPADTVEAPHAHTDGGARDAIRAS
jgi:AGZA family xanthine/uracil permease-like MFS transporter